MGSLCSCFQAPETDDESVDSDDIEQVQDTSGAVNRTAPAYLASFLQDLTNKCEAVLGRRGAESIYQGPSSSQPTMAQSSSSGSSSSGTSISFMRHEKGLNYSRVNFRSTPSEEGSKKGHPETPLMVASDKVKPKVNTISVDDEDVCPICLEEYTSENPRIITKCSHHYHLSCIYEWNERSKTCPVCSKLMVFEEMAWSRYPFWVHHIKKALAWTMIKESVCYHVNGVKTCSFMGEMVKIQRLILFITFIIFYSDFHQLVKMVLPIYKL